MTIRLSRRLGLALLLLLASSAPARGQCSGQNAGEVLFAISSTTCDGDAAFAWDTSIKALSITGPTVRGSSLTILNNPSGQTYSHIVGVDVDARSGTSTFASPFVYAVSGIARHLGTSTGVELTGAWFRYNADGSTPASYATGVLVSGENGPEGVTSAVGVEVYNIEANTAAFGIRIGNVSANTAAYGIYLDDTLDAPDVYALYSASAAPTRLSGPLQMAAAVTFVPDNTHDIGAGSLRPRTIYAGSGFSAAGLSGLSTTKTVRAAWGASNCTLIFTGGLLTGGTC